MVTQEAGIVHSDVIVVGAGFAGIGVAAKILAETELSVAVLERASDLGGTWRDNDYPGSACDVPSHLYSYSFSLNPEWSHMFAPQREILEYIRDVARDQGVLELIRFDNEVIEAAWDANTATWAVTTNAGVYRARAVVSAVGHLSDPKMPAIEGLQGYQGELFHSAQWRHDVSLDGRRVAVIGSGASAIQIVPEIAKVAGQLTVFQRSAPYVTARHDREYTEAERRMFSRLPETMKDLREEFFWANEERYAQRRGTPSLIETVTRSALDHLASQIPDGELRDKLTPDYTIGCKRILKSSDYYPTFLRDNVSLLTEPIERFTSAGIRTVDGREHEFDVVIASTGFEATDLPIAHRVRGRAGQLLSTAWDRGMEAFGTVAVHGFPNLWIINGPNTGLGHNSAIYIAESQFAHILEALKYQSERGEILEVSAEQQQAYMERVEELSQGTVWLEGGCRSWYVDPRSNRLTTLWPDFAFTFREVNSEFAPTAYERALQDASS